MSARRMVTYGIGAVVIAALFGALVLRVASDPQVKANIGDSVFRVGRADRIAKLIDERGELLFQDPTGGGQNLVIDHEGDDPETGWHARLHGTPDEFPTRIENGYLLVDLRAGARPPSTLPPSTTGPPSTTTSTAKS